MRISELVAKLQELRAKYGDLVVTTWGSDYGQCAVDTPKLTYPDGTDDGELKGEKVHVCFSPHYSDVVSPREEPKFRV